MRHERTMINPNIMFGNPVVKDTRITVELILRKLAAGKTITAMSKTHPHLTVEDVYAVADFAADYLAQEEIVFADGQSLRRL